MGDVGILTRSGDMFQHMFPTPFLTPTGGALYTQLLVAKGRKRVGPSQPGPCNLPRSFKEQALDLAGFVSVALLAWQKIPDAFPLVVWQ